LESNEYDLKYCVSLKRNVTNFSDHGILTNLGEIKPGKQQVRFHPTNFGFGLVRHIIMVN
jgi:hypothetical protein